MASSSSFISLAEVLARVNFSGASISLLVISSRVKPRQQPF
jgi:hypothetical protein